ncbi:MAG: DUF6159 family protein [Methanoregulaceae archaeon]|jgi:hypothetical protein
MFDSISRSFELVKASWEILMQDKKLLAFPILSGFFTLLVIISFFIPLLISGNVMFMTTKGVGSLLLLFVLYVISYFVVIFFNTGLITCVNAHLQGRNITLWEGLENAVRHINSNLGMGYYCCYCRSYSTDD